MLRELQIGPAAERLSTSPPESRALRGPMPAQMYPRGVELLRQGVLPDEVMYVDHGLVKLVHVDRRGTEAILGLAVGGAWLGSASAILGVASPVAAISCTRARVQRIPAPVFRDLLERESELGRLIHEAHARELHRQTAWLAQLSSLTARERLERVIRHLIVALGLQAAVGRVRLQLPLHHWEIARLIAITPEHLSRLLKQMQDDGVIHRDKGWMIVPDLARLCPQPDDAAAPWESGGAAHLDLHQDRT